MPSSTKSLVGAESRRFGWHDSKLLGGDVFIDLCTRMMALRMISLLLSSLGRSPSRRRRLITDESTVMFTVGRCFTSCHTRTFQSFAVRYFPEIVFRRLYDSMPECASSFHAENFLDFSMEASMSDATLRPILCLKLRETPTADSSGLSR